MLIFSGKSICSLRVENISLQKGSGKTSFWSFSLNAIRYFPQPLSSLLPDKSLTSILFLFLILRLFKTKRKIRDFYLINQIFALIFFNTLKKGPLCTDNLLSEKIQSCICKSGYVCNSVSCESVFFSDGARSMRDCDP